MKPYRFNHCARAFMGALLLVFLTSACQPHVIVATKAEYRSFTTLLQQEQEQLEKMQQLGSRLEGMHNELLEARSDAVDTLRQRVDEQETELHKLRRELDDLRREVEEQERTRNSTNLHLGASRQLATPAKTTDSRGKQVVGAEERIFLAPPGKAFPARIDTGANTSSVDARSIELFERNGEPWVSFTLLDPETEEDIEVERKVVRNVSIVQAVSDNKEERQVVEFQITLGNTTRSAEFTLADRSHMEFPVLVGRNILKDAMSVDVSKKHISSPLSRQDPDNSSR
ncbi:MAG: RimK/LysX family protein [Desulfuromonadaceae bacterium]